MQWSPDRNAGFSKGDFAQLYLPPLMDPVYGYPVGERGGAAAQPELVPPLDAPDAPGPQGLPAVRDGRVRDRRLRQPFGARLREGAGPSYGPQGRPSSPSEPAPRATGDPDAESPVLCVHNLSRFAQPAWLDLVRWAGRTPVELLGRVPFPAVAGGLTHMTLGPHGFYWFELVEESSLDPEPSAERSLMTPIGCHADRSGTDA